ncbi:MAG: SMI1/KNR4 family protein [Veillonella sp.]|uniref:SMI1/KNR4 family protein n=1 Tax=Veillonella sp. TaxID=1926307 RepID=UPI00291185A5|nr:SMI1/KNR4 family protein [Veillonella sp.]MDU5003486.1 SMI1/KNR4 family protein [Veillonella sp.]
MKIKELIEKLEQKSSHQFLKAVSKPEFAFPLPKDLEFFYENYEYAILNIDTYCEIRISSLSELQPTNQILYPADDVIWEELADDISNDWFMIASSQELSQYISIDLNKKRFGFCYDSFIETHATPDESPIIAKSFTELLEKLVSNENQQVVFIGFQMKKFKFSKRTPLMEIKTQHSNYINTICLYL